MKAWVALLSLGLLGLVGCQGQTRSSAPASPGIVSASVPEDLGDFDEEFAKQKIAISDPLEGCNRFMFEVNDRLYFWVLKPVARAYKAVLPEPVRIGVRSFFHNAATPPRLVSCLLQGKHDRAGKELDRFVVNTTVGILGLTDPAKDRYHLTVADDEDTGQVLARSGLGHGPFLVLPLLGPSSLRDAVGLIADRLMTPLTYLEPWEASVGCTALGRTNALSLRLGDYETLKEASVEPYAAMREAYVQHRDKQVSE